MSNNLLTAPRENRPVGPLRREGVRSVPGPGGMLKAPWVPRAPRTDAAIKSTHFGGHQPALSLLCLRHSQRGASSSRGASGPLSAL